MKNWLRWLILLVMAISPISNNIDKYILFEFLTISNCKFNNPIDKFWLICVDMNDGSLNRFCNVCAVKACSSFSRSSCETDLIVCYNMNGSIDIVMIQITHLKALENYTLTCNSSVSMNQNTQNIFLRLFSILNSLNMSHYDRVNCFKMRRVW